jgi:hypothetical protein
VSRHPHRVTTVCSRQTTTSEGSVATSYAQEVDRHDVPDDRLFVDDHPSRLRRSPGLRLIGIVYLTAPQPSWGAVGPGERAACTHRHPPDRPRRAAEKRRYLPRKTTRTSRARRRRRRRPVHGASAGFLVGYPPHSSRAYFSDLRAWRVCSEPCRPGPALAGPGGPLYGVRHFVRRMIASVNFVVHVNWSQVNVDTCALALPGLKTAAGPKIPGPTSIA